MVTALITNYKRYENISRVIDSIRSQDVEIKVLLVNNGEPADFSADIIVQKNNENKSHERWLQCRDVQTEFVFSLDDDLCLTDRSVIRRGLDLLLKMPKDAIIGPYGVVNDGPTYCLSSHVYCGDRIVDVVKGRLLFTRTDLVKSALPHKLEETTTDDIFLSSFSDNLFCPSLFLDSLKELPDNDALCHMESHYPNRDKAFKKYIKDKIGE